MTYYLKLQKHRVDIIDRFDSDIAVPIKQGDQMTAYLPDENYDYLTAQLAQELVEAANRFAYRNGLQPLDMNAMGQASTSAAEWAQELMVFALDAWPASIAGCIGEAA